MVERIPQSKAVEMLNRLQAFEAAMLEKQMELNPMFYGMPDLLFEKGKAPGKLNRTTGVIERETLFPDESDADYATRQDEALEKCIREYLKVQRDGGVVEPEIIPEMLELISDIFFGRVKKAILWACRGGGKSLAAAIIIWLLLVYLRKSIVNMASTGEQSKRIYEYTKGFWDCLVPGTPIVTERGFVPIEDVCVGDRVLTEDGSFRSVVRVIERPYKGPIVNTETLGGWTRGFTTTLDHRVLTAPGEWTKAEDLGDKRVFFPMVRSKKMSKPLVLRDAWRGEALIGKVERSSRHRDKLVIGDTEGFARLVGYWLAEGYFCGGAYMVGFAFGDHERDKPHVEDVCALAKSIFGVKAHVRRHDSVVTVRFSSRILCSWLRERCRSGARNKKIPRWFLTRASRDVISQLLRGIVAGDGHVDRDRWVVAVNTISPALASGIWLLFNRLGYWASVSLSKGGTQTILGRVCETQPQYRVTLGASACRRLLDEWSESYRAPDREVIRKQEIESTNDGFFVPVMRQKTLYYKGPVYDLTVDAVHSFATPGGVMHNCVPGLKKGMLEDDPLMRETRMRGKTKLICCSGEQGVGEHLPVFIVDEACTDKAQAENNILRAMQGTFDHEDHIVLMLSTFHHPVGLFQQYWDGAPEFGFKRYKWSVYDIMSPCTLGLEEATPEDPWAQNTYCLKKCALSRLEDKRDDFGKIVGKEWKGCCGRARTSAGWQSYKQVFAKFESNKGTRIFIVEHECNRPSVDGQIYSPVVIDSCVVDSFPLDRSCRKVVGIDWGLTECFMVLLGEWIDGPLRGIGVVATRVMSNKLTDEVIEQIRYWQKWFGDEILVRADHSHPYCNMELVKKGRFRVKTVKGDKDKKGEDNVQRWLSSGVLKILREQTRLITQLKNVRNDDEGKQVKDNRDDERGDHGPDALKFALMAFDFVKWLKKHRPELFDGTVSESNDGDDD